MAGAEGFGGMSPQQMQAMLGAMSGSPPDLGGGVPQYDPMMFMQMFQYFQGLQGLSQPPLGGGMSGMPSVHGMPALPGMHGVPGMPGMSGMSPISGPGMSPYAPQHSSSPSINVSVEGMKFQYQLTEDDLQKVFSRYGSVQKIRVEEVGSSAQISFHNMTDAQAAMNDLNGKVLNGLEGTLRISWTPPPSVPPPYPQMPFPAWGFPPAASPSWPMPAGPPMLPMMRESPHREAPHRDRDRDGDRSQHVKGVRKYTCRFLIGIENDKDFQVARRIIGSKGTNMKKIVKTSDAKLRLRGIGSGYFEGGSQKESNEPLQLCVSCISPEGYTEAVKDVEELLMRVYDEYRKFCQETGKLIPELKINLSENQPAYSSRAQGTGSLLDISADASDGGAGFPAGADDDKRDRRNRKPRKGREPTAEDGGGPIERGDPSPNAPTVQEIERYIDQRNEARRANSFSEADRIREFLHSRGVALMDEPGGRGRGTEVTTWRYWRD